MKYIVGVAVKGSIYVEVDADDVEDAKRKADIKFIDADLGDLHCIGYDMVNAEDENGVRTDY